MSIALLALVLTGGAIVWYWRAQNVETPSYRVVESEGAIEVREYPPLIAAEVQRSGARWEAVSRGFGPLAGYIFAKERPGEKIAMTAPVTQQRTSTVAPSGAAGPDNWRVRFIMPSKYTRSELPDPARDDVRLVEVPTATVAAIRFSGVATDALIEEKQAELMRWLDAHDLEPTAPPTYAYYNDPFTPGFLRRNEVMVHVAR